VSSLQWLIRRIVICGPPGSTMFFQIIKSGEKFEKKKKKKKKHIAEHKMCFDSRNKLVRNVYHFKKKLER